MIKVEVFKSEDHYAAISISGHAYSDEPGKDLVCAAVSILAQTVVNAVEEVGNVSESNYFAKIKKGLFKFRIDKEYRSDVTDIIIRTFLVGIEGIEKTYSMYVTLKIKEVQGDVKNF